jgi:4-amino-4-deoxy-L-arabinose transferase-like glycosyltransferase
MQKGLLIEKKWTNRSGRFELAIITALYFLLLAPIMPEVSTYHSDECFYTDSATYMMQHQDWITPHYPDGSLRINKPILTYWTIAASYWILGIDYFATRLPFLIAGCFTVLMGYALSRKLFQKSGSAVLTAVILVSNIQLIHISLRSTPDILQCLFLNISLYGFVLLIFYNDTRLRNYIITYVGAALAIETKGLLGFTTVFYAFVFVLCGPKMNRNIKNLIHVPTILLSAILATGWFFLIYIKHGDTALNGFFQDQAGTGMDIEGSGFYVLSNLIDYSGGVFRHFMPWILLLLIGFIFIRKESSDFAKRNKRAILFICGWFLFLLAIFINGKMSRTRYLLPAYPVLSALFASFLTEMFRHTSMIRVLRYAYSIFLILVGICAIAFIGAGLWMESRILLAGVFLLPCSTMLYYFSFIKKKLEMSSAFGINILVAISVVYVFIIPTFRVSPSEKLTECILQSMDGKSKSISVWSKEKYKLTGQINVLSKGRVSVFELPEGPLPDNLYQRPLVILSEESKSGLNLTEYDVHPCGTVYRSVKPETVREVLKTGDPDMLFHSIKQNYYLARKRG